jgi:hypothetical protein
MTPHGVVGCVKKARLGRLILESSPPIQSLSGNCCRALKRQAPPLLAVRITDRRCLYSCLSGRCSGMHLSWRPNLNSFDIVLFRWNLATFLLVLSQQHFYP